eukprot:13533273-Alexandrium_andersonii.AAC.1
MTNNDSSPPGSLEAVSSERVRRQAKELPGTWWHPHRTCQAAFVAPLGAFHVKSNLPHTNAVGARGAATSVAPGGAG